MYIGVQVGIVVGMPLSGALAESFGWETVFYVFGGLGAIWFAIWSFLIKGNYLVSDPTSGELKSTIEYKEASLKGKSCMTNR